MNRRKAVEATGTTVSKKTLYYYSPASYLFENLALKRVKVSRITDLNDPYEVFAINRRSKKAAQQLEEWRRQTNTELGVVCLSKNEWNPVMWAHYADRHRGVCYRFEVSEARLCEVNYLCEPEKVDVVDRLSEFDRTDWLMSHKSYEWSYEKETRMVVKLSDAIHDGGFYFKCFSDTFLLRGIRLGMSCRVSPEAVRAASAAANLDIKVSKMKMSSTSFRIIENRESRANRGQPRGETRRGKTVSRPGVFG
jgi:hypothetical protein